MRRTTGLITFIVFLLIVAGGVVTVLALGTKTGVAMGGGSTVTGSATKALPFTAQAGWVRNNSPWPVDITSITVNASSTAATPQIFLSPAKTALPVTDGSAAAEATAAAAIPAWATTPVKLPYTLKGGELRYFGFSVVPESGKIASFDQITIGYKGPLGFAFDSTFSGVAVAASPENLPNELVANDPAADSESLDGYIALLRSALKSGNIKQIQQVMGDSATPEDAAAVKKAEKGYKTALVVAATKVTADSRTQTLVFYKTDATKDGLKPLTVQWQDFRWSVTAW